LSKDVKKSEYERISLAHDIEALRKRRQSKQQPTTSNELYGTTSFSSSVSTDSNALYSTANIHASGRLPIRGTGHLQLQPTELPNARAILTQYGYSPPIVSADNIYEDVDSTLIPEAFEALRASKTILPGQIPEPDTGVYALNTSTQVKLEHVLIPMVSAVQSQHSVKKLPVKSQVLNPGPSPVYSSTREIKIQNSSKIVPPSAQVPNNDVCTFLGNCKCSKCSVA
jgi:hypothetical protein